MYKMPEFTEKDTAVVLDFIQANTFAIVTGNADQRSVATQVPLLVSERDGRLLLRGHIMRKTDHHLAFQKNPEVLVLFTGPHCYVSASWYAERHTGSTWNYMTVHARGKMRFLDEKATTGIITELTHKYEDGQDKPELVENMPADYVQPMVKAIVGFEIIVESVEPIFKLSQNRSDESYKSIVSHLRATGNYDEEQIAQEMVTRRPELF